ncbi:proteome of centrioles 1 [Choristoneura fumiferana]|uniref:proteome of centrioles 1 n=1 Tax=Choristoneura fumiferana TaxID=7141 RepID=UPI003D15D211
MEDDSTLLEPSLEKQLEGHKNGITSLFYSPNEHQVATSSLDNSILLWELRGCMKSYRFQGHDEAVMDVTFSPSGRRMASASRDKSVRLWVPTVTGSTGVFKAHSQTVRSVQFTPDESKILTASDDKIVKLWASDKYKFIASFVGHTNWVRCARISNDGSVIASCSDDKTAKLWNPDSGECVHTYKDQKGHGLCVAWHPSGCYIAVGTSYGNVKLYDVRTHNLVQYYSIHSDAVTQLAFHPSGSYVITASKDGKMKILDLLEGHPIFTLRGHTGAVNAVNFSPSGDSFASAGEDKQVFIWKTNFTEVASEMKENVEQRVPTSQNSKSTTSVKAKKQGVKIWYLCYHSSKYPATTFSHIDSPVSTCGSRSPSFQEHPRANSTLRDGSPSCKTGSCSKNSSNPLNISGKHSLPNKSQLRSGSQSAECSSYSVGHISHIPRTPPTPTTYTIPSIGENTDGNGTKVNGTGYTNTTCAHKEDLFGMIKLREHDVCYTSGTIEWVGRKRSFPINTGFKLINESQKQSNEPLLKKVKRLDKTYTCNVSNNMKDCDCADVLPTVNAIVDHLNALHEAVDLVDLRINTLEDTLCKD